MRRCIKYCAMVVFMAGLMLAASAGSSVAGVAAVEDTTWDSWSNTVYYFSRLSGPNAPYNSYTVRVTAVDRYSLWINGKRIDTSATNDNDYATVDSMVVSSIGTKELLIAVKVENLGLGNGNGLMVDITAGSDWLGTTTLKRYSVYDEANTSMKTYPAVWYCYVGDIVTDLGKSDWYNFNQTFLDNASTNGLKDVIFGNMNEINYTPNSHIEVIAGFGGDVDTGAADGGGIQLRRIDGENIALGKPIVTKQLTDGNIELGQYYTSDPITADSMEVYLEDYYKVKRVRIYTGGSDPQKWPSQSVLGYSVLTSNTPTSSDYTEQEVINDIGVSNADNGGFDYSDVTFAPVYARYVRCGITHARTDNPHVGEIMIYGTGYMYSGEYVSPWYDFGTPTTIKNFGTVTWEGIIPQGTSIKIQTQSTNSSGVVSDWSGSHSEKSFDFDSPEPAVKFRYKVLLTTDSVDITPTFQSLNITYSSMDQPLISGNASVTPLSVPMGVDTTFTYHVNYTLSADQDIKHVVIMVPNYSIMDSIYLYETNSVLYSPDDYTSTSTIDSLYITFVNPVTNISGAGADSMKIFFRTSLLKNIHNFESGVFNSTMNDGVGILKLGKNPSASWMVTTSSVISKVLSDVKAIPKGFTPNNDGKNDFSIIEFTLANIISAKVTIKIYSTDGTLVTVLLDEDLAAGDYRIPDSAKRTSTKVEQMKMPGYWDGKDEDGDLVKPGIYIYQIVVDTEDGDKIESGAIAVAY